MAEIRIEHSCERFRKGISPEDNRSLQKVSIDDVRHAVRQIERQLAARQCLRNLDRLSPYLDAIERYSKTVEVLSNAVPFLPYAWVSLEPIISLMPDPDLLMPRRHP